MMDFIVIPVVASFLASFACGRSPMYGWMRPLMAGALALIATHALAACKAPSLPYEPDAQPDGSCAVLDEITAQRLVRTPDGTPLVIHCKDGGTP